MVNGHKSVIGIVSVRGRDYHPTRRLIEAASARGAEIMVIDPYRVWPGFAGNHPLLLGRSEAKKPDAILPRQGAEIRDCCLPLLRHYQQAGLVIVNSLEAILKARNKFFTLQALVEAGLPVADTIFVNRRRGLEAALRFFGGRAVVKPVSGRQGAGIRLLRSADQMDAGLAGELDSGRGLMVQEFIAPEGRRDFRALVIGTEVVAAMELVPAAGEFRANFGLGGRPRKVALRPEEVQAAVGATRAIGLEIAGVDLMLAGGRPVLVGEVNYSPGFRALEEVSGRDIAAAMLDHVLEVIGRQRRI